MPRAKSAKPLTPEMLHGRLFMRATEFFDLTATPHPSGYRLLLEGKIQGAIKLGGTWRIPVSFIEKLRSASASEGSAQ